MSGAEPQSAGPGAGAAAVGDGAARAVRAVRARPSLPDDQKQEIVEAFNLFDSEKRGYLDLQELKVRVRAAVLSPVAHRRAARRAAQRRACPLCQVAMRALGFPVKRDEVRALAAEFGGPGATTLSRADFIEALSERYASRDPEEEIRKAFALFDEDGSGRISLRNLRRIARELGEPLADDELQAMIDEFDRDGDGLIDADDFARIMRSTSLY